MIKKKKASKFDALPTAANANGRASPSGHLAPPRGGIPAEAAHSGTVVGVLAVMMFLAPAMGVSHEEMLQDTLKSIIVSFGVLGAGLLFFWRQRLRSDPLRWHALMYLPLALMAYALGSMVWSHPFLGGVEAIRWFVFSLLLWLGLNSFSPERLAVLAWGVHAGAVFASLWTALQFWVDLRYFPQGPNPASTFVNRNFFAEFAVCALPFSAWLLARARTSAHIAVLSFSSAFIMVALMMTGTRGALIAMALLLVLLPTIAVLYRRQLAFCGWTVDKKLLACGLLTGTVFFMGMIPTGNPNIAAEARGTTALARAFTRTASVSVGDESLGVRFVMWKATLRMIQARPFSGVGAGAWEVDIPLYQSEGSQLETDYYVHNEFLQLVAEYGLLGWLFLLSLFAYLLLAAWKTLTTRTPQGQAEAPMRAVVLSSLLVLLIVSNVGFPWRLTSTVAMFAICLGVLAASDARLGFQGATSSKPLNWAPVYSRTLALALIFCAALAAYISQQAAMAESKIVRAAKLAISITYSGDFHNRKWNNTKREMLTLAAEGIAINPHYRKVTPMVADELARWGDWKNAIWIWESVVASRPYVVAMMTNIARGYVELGNLDKAFEYLERCKRLQPKAPSVRSLEVILLSRTGKGAEAASLVKQYLSDGAYDYDLLNSAWTLGVQSGDYALAIQGMELRNKGWPTQRVDGLIKLGYLHAFQLKDEARALVFYKGALAATPERYKGATLERIPPDYRGKL